MITGERLILYRLLGGLEMALFMKQGRMRFDGGREEALRSFLVPVLLFPLSLALVFFYKPMALVGMSVPLITLLYGARLVAGWVLFLGCVRWITDLAGRAAHFWPFVIACNWLAIPATAVFLPVMAMMASGSHPLEELHSYVVLTSIYVYAFTAYMTLNMLRVPWQLAIAIVILSIAVEDMTQAGLDFTSRMLA